MSRLPMPKFTTTSFLGVAICMGWKKFLHSPFVDNNVHLINSLLLLIFHYLNPLTSVTTIFNILPLWHWWQQFLNFQFLPPLDINDKGLLLTAPPVNISPHDMLLFLNFVHYKEITPNLCLICSNASLGSGLVNISAICSFVSIYSNLTTFVILSLLKNYTWSGYVLF